MATQSGTKKKNTNSRNTGSSRSTGSGRGGSRSSGNQKGKSRSGGNGSDKLTNIFLLLLLVTIIVLAVLYFKNSSGDSGDAAPTPTGQVQPGGVTAQPEDGTGQDTVTPVPPATPTPVPTAAEPTGGAGEITDVPQETSTPEAIVTPTPKVSSPAADHILTAEADEILADVFWEEGYRFTLTDSEFTVAGTVYYRYDTFYGGVAQSYDVLVRRSDGELYYYENGSLREFDGVPAHTEQTETDAESNEMTSDRAAELLRQFPYTSLGLPAELDECSLVLDNWKTVVDGVECSCLNVFYNGTLAGSIYFTEDAAHVYYLDEFGEFVRVR